MEAYLHLWFVPTFPLRIEGNETKSWILLLSCFVSPPLAG